MDTRIGPTIKKKATARAYTKINSLTHVRRPVVDWAAGTPGKIPVGRAARVGVILAARAACTVQ